MDDKNKNTATAPEGETDTATTDTAADTTTADTAADSGTGKAKKSDVKRLKAEVEALTAALAEKDAALAEAEDKHLRLMAEYDNFRRRSKEEKGAVYSEAVSDAVTELLPLFDNLERAAKFTTGDAAGAAKGVEMILSSVPAILEKLGVTSFGEEGDSFDPNIHNAVMHEEDSSLGEGVITDVFQKGYRHGDRVIRFAMVKVVN